MKEILIKFRIEDEKYKTYEHLLQNLIDTLQLDEKIMVFEKEVNNA